jgi:capsule polysaccharide export protein KpsE/RkpR
MVNILKQKLEDAKSQPGFAGNFSLENATGVAMEYLRLTTEFETFTKVKNILMPMLEEARIEETRNTQNLIIIDPPFPADKKVKPKRSLFVVGFFIGSFVLCSMFVVMLDGYSKFKKKYNAMKKG